jgi:hypothetical protein
MIPMVHVLSTETGDYPITDKLAAIYQACRIRSDGQPDARTRYGKIWYKEFNAFRDEKLREYLAA